jgi:hypothetical protein
MFAVWIFYPFMGNLYDSAVVRPFRYYSKTNACQTKDEDELRGRLLPATLEELSPGEVVNGVYERNPFRI